MGATRKSDVSACRNGEGEVMTDPTFDLEAEVAKETAAYKGKVALRKLVASHGAITVAGWLHGIVYAKPVNDKCKEHCRDGLVTVGSYAVTVPSTAPCPLCRPEERAAYEANDPMADDMRRHTAKYGSGVRRAWD